MSGRLIVRLCGLTDFVLCKAPYAELSIVERLNDSLAHNLNQLICIPARNVAGRRHGQHARYGLAIATPQTNFVSGFNRVRRLCRPAVKENKARVAKLLS